MSYLKSYRRINTLLQNESFEPLVSWGFRMALSGTLPIVWGLATGRLADAVWMTLSAEAVSWVEMKGSFGWRVRTLLTGAVLAVVFAVLGTVTGNSLWLSVVGMFVVGYFATLLKDIGDRASGLAICVYLLFIICNAYPVADVPELIHRFLLVMIGAVFPVITGIASSVLMPEEEPFRRHIGLVWRTIGGLIDSISRRGYDKDDTALSAAVYLKEKEVRTAMDNSYEFFGRMTHQVDKGDNKKYQLALLRKVAGLVAVNVIAIGDEIDHIAVRELDETLRIKAATLFSAMKESVSRIAVYIITLKPEEKLLAVSHISRLQKLATLIREYPLEAGTRQTIAINRILQLTDRTVKLLESAIQRIEHMGKDAPVYRSYSFIKTLVILKPRHFAGSLRILFNFNSFTTRYALRSAIAVTAAMFIFKWFHIDHGYWLPFSVMIVIQPYFNATLEKARDRVIGTVLGGLAGGLFLYLPAGLHVKEAVLFLTFIVMVYYVRKNYAVAVFVITLNLVLLFNLDSSYSNMLMVVRTACTVGGAALAVISGLALLPVWDKKWLPAHLSNAIKGNYEYFTATFFPAGDSINWIGHKRNAESANSNVFDSFNRYMEEPGKEKTAVYYDLITHNIRITRDLNNIHLEQEEKKTKKDATATAMQQQRMWDCLLLFNTVMGALHSLHSGAPVSLTSPGAPPRRAPFLLNEAQMISLEKLIIELRTMERDLKNLANPTAEN